MRFRRLFSFFALILLCGCASRTDLKPEEEPQFKIGTAVHDLHSLKVNLEQADKILPFLSPDLGDPYRSQLAQDGRVLAALTNRVAADVETMRRYLREPFESFAAPTLLGFRAAHRHRPFATGNLDDLTFEMYEGAMVIKKGGGTSVYHVSPDFVLPSGPCISIKYRLPTQGRRGGTPVPHFGVRDETGEEEVILSFSTYPKPDEVHQILVFRNGDRFGAIHKGFVSVVRFKGDSDRAYAYFLLNDQSQVVLEEIRLPTGATAGSFRHFF